jgi:hypothetical protein
VTMAMLMRGQCIWGGSETREARSGKRDGRTSFPPSA